MEKRLRLRIVFLFVLLIYLIAFFFLYYKYVPLIKSFQMVLVPVLILVLAITIFNLEWGTLFFVFFFPLINSLPYFFGIDTNIPHAPTALVLFLAFFLGWLFNSIFSSDKVKFGHPVFKPLILLSLVISVSGFITFFRHVNFFPFFSDKVLDLVVNVNGVRAGGAIMSDVLSLLNYLTGFIFFLILFNTIKSKKFVKKVLVALTVSIFLSLLLSLVQRYYSLSLGNTSYWIKLNRVNSTFKDPNSFGIVLSAFIPLLLGLSLFFQRRFMKVFALFLILFAFFVFPFTGSRSGFLGFVISMITFFLLFISMYKVNLKKKIIYMTSFFLILVLFFFSVLFLSRQSSLYKRIEWSIEVLASKDAINELSRRKIDFWAAASNMTREYPLTGVGIGAFIVELPNYLKLMDLPFKYTDSAENYFFQVGSELGLIGLFIVVWMFIEIIRGMGKAWKNPRANNKDRFILVGAISGTVSIFVNFFFHSYIGSFEVKYFFWLMIAIIFFFSQDDLKSSAKTKFGNRFKIIAIVLPVFFGAVHLWDSAHFLSIENGTERFGWNQNFGLYHQEKDQRGFRFCWTKKNAGVSVENVGTELVVPILASHPDIKKKPVKVKVYLADKHFRIRELIREILIRRNGWMDFVCKIQESFEDKLYFIFETDRVWQPMKYLGTPDARRLAIGLGEFWFKYSGELVESEIQYIQRISHKNWEGKLKDKLYTNGISYLKFKTEKKNFAIRLHLRGAKAFDAGPFVIIRLDDKIIGRTRIDVDDWTYLLLMPRGVNIGEHEFSVEYTNDINKPELRQDRNIFLGDLEIMYMH